MTEQLLLSEKSLARKWGISHKTLQRWRWLKTGPAYIKLVAVSDIAPIQLRNMKIAIFIKLLLLRLLQYQLQLHKNYE